jgi:hypothetical protein
MNPARVVDENAPAFIPVSAHWERHRVEVTPPSVVIAPLSQLIGKAKGSYDDAAAVDQFIRAGRDEWTR